MNRRLFAAAALALLFPGMALAQVFVIPRRPDKSAVNSFDFQWQHVDILVGPEAKGMAGPPDHTAHEAPPGAPGGPTSHAPSTTPTGTSGPNTAVAERREGPTPTQTGVDPGALVAEAPDGGMDGGMTAGLPADTTDGGTVAVATPDGGMDGGTAISLPSGATMDGGWVFYGPADAGVKYATNLGTSAGGVRFYFYERERTVAEMATPIIEGTYRELVDRFHYVPTQTFPYILYSSYREFLESHLFPLSEGTLGITSTEDLKLTLPYLGDHKLFEEVCRHEMTHQFTIQKVRTLAGNKLFGDPLSAMPLWFVEGLAEYYAKGVDPEAEMMARDLLVNPDVMKGYAFLDFWSPGPYGYLWIYKVGQIRVAFLEEEYGAGFAQRVLDASPQLAGGSPGSSSMSFEKLLQKLTGDDPKKIASRFEAWMKRRAFKSYLASKQTAPTFDMLEEREGIITSMASGPDGRLIMYRTIIPETGQSRLYVVDPKAPTKAVMIAGDGVPGVESLHPISGRNFALSKDKLVFIAESNARDVLYVHPYRYKSEERSQDVLVRRNPVVTGIQSETALHVDLNVGSARAYPMQKHGILAMYSPAFSPDGKQLAFIGINDAGMRDVYTINLEEDPLKAAPKRVTDDVFAERQLTWGPTGIIYTSDATSHRKFNLFRVKPEKPNEVERLTSEEVDEADPLHLPDGRIFFVAYRNSSNSDLNELMKDGRIVRRTDVNTGVFEPGAGPEGALWMLFHYAGERRPATLRPEKMLAIQEAASPPPEPPAPLAQRPLSDSQMYDSFARKNFELGPIMGFAGAGGGAFVGQLYASATDRMRNHALLLSLAIYGSLDLTDGYLLYLNQEKRTTWGVGLFQSLRFRVDQTFPTSAGPGYLFSSGERFFGAMGSARYPLNTFFYLQGDMGIGGASYFLDRTSEFLLYTDPNGDFYTPWKAANRGVRFQTEGSVQLGYNTIRYHYAGGPLAGSSALLETTTAVQPFDSEVFGNVRLDAEHYFPIYGRSNFSLRGGAGTTFGGRFARSYFLSSFDTLRGVNFGDETWLLGRNFYFATGELKIPLNDIIRVAFLSDLVGVAGVDFGGVGYSGRNMWDRRVLDFAVGANFLLGPLLLRLHFARPIDVGSPYGKPDPGWVTNFSVGIAGLNGFFDKKNDAPSQRPAMPETGYVMPRGAF